MSKQTNTTKTDLSAGTEKQDDSGVKEGDPPVAKRSGKMTEKAILAKVEDLQKERKCLLKRAISLRMTIADLMVDKSFVKEVRPTFEKYTTLCDQAVAIQESLLKFMPPDECEKHEVWFKVKMMQTVNDFVAKDKQMLELQ